MKTRFCYTFFWLVVPWVGIEPTLCNQNWILNPARLPIPPPRLILGMQIYEYFFSNP